MHACFSNFLNLSFRQVASELRFATTFDSQKSIWKWFKRWELRCSSYLPHSLYQRDTRIGTLYCEVGTPWTVAFAFVMLACRRFVELYPPRSLVTTFLSINSPGDRKPMLRDCGRTIRQTQRQARILRSLTGRGSLGHDLG
jgi:hypothetical protein